MPLSQFKSQGFSATTEHPESNSVARLQMYRTSIARSTERLMEQMNRSVKPKRVKMRKSTAFSWNPQRRNRGSRMADRKKIVSQNVPGEFFVDTTCIDCDTCRQLAPTVFEDNGEFSYVQ